MQLAFEKLLLSLIIPTYVSLHLLPLVDSSFLDNDENHEHHSSSKMSHRLIFDIQLHGILLWVSMGFFMPLGLIAIRMSNKDRYGRKMLQAIFYFHAILQVAGVVLVTAGAILSMKSFDNSFSNSHQRIGLALYVAVWVQALIGLRRPKRGTRSRRTWYLFHWIFGTVLTLVGIFNVYTGLHAYHKRTSRSISLWSILFMAEISVMALCYLLQDKWGYIKKQGVTLGNEQNTAASDQVLPLGENQKDVLPVHESRRKSNSLGNYFAKKNALKKLFQLT